VSLLGAELFINMNTKSPAIVFLVLGLAFIVFNRLILVGIQWLDKKTWNEEKRRRFPGHGGKSSEYKLWMFVFLGISWIACAVFFWFTSE
jgi:hypothetical protein